MAVDDAAMNDTADTCNDTKDDTAADARAAELTEVDSWHKVC